jgi:hypothetical protein
MTYSTIFWDNPHDSNKILLLHKKVIRIMAAAHKREPSTGLFRKFHRIHLASEYILALITLSLRTWKNPRETLKFTQW